MNPPQSYGKIKPIVASTGKPIRCTPRPEPDPWIELAINIHHGSDSYSASPRNRVYYHYENFGEEWPEEDPTPGEFERVIELVAEMQ